MIEKKVPVEVWSRTVGYYRPTSQWNKGKQEEFKDRAFIDPKSIELNYEEKRIHGFAD